MSKMTLNLNLSFWIVCSVATSKFADCETKTRSRKCENYLRLHHYQQHISHAHSHLTYCYKALNFCSNHQSCGCNTETTHPGLCFIFSTVPVASCPHRWSPLWFTKHSFFFFFFNSLYTALEVLLQYNNIMLPYFLLPCYRGRSVIVHMAARQENINRSFLSDRCRLFSSEDRVHPRGVRRMHNDRAPVCFKCTEKDYNLLVSFAKPAIPRFLFDSPSSSGAVCVCVREFLCVYWI